MPRVESHAGARARARVGLWRGKFKRELGAKEAAKIMPTEAKAGQKPGRASLGHRCAEEGPANLREGGVHGRIRARARTAGRAINRGRFKSGVWRAAASSR